MDWAQIEKSQFLSQDGRNCKEVSVIQFPLKQRKKSLKIAILHLTGHFWLDTASA